MSEASDDPALHPTEGHPGRGGSRAGADGDAGPSERKIRYRYTPGLTELLGQAGCSLLVSTYQAGKLVAIGQAEGKLELSFHNFEQAMGVAVGTDRVAVGAHNQVWMLARNREVAPSIKPAGRHDCAFLTRSAVTTGEIRGHELAWGEDERGRSELWVVNTLFSCLATLDPAYSFVPRWRPPFITALAAEDRCHLNGLALNDGRPALVTAMAATDTPGGWRDDKARTGRIIEVESGETVTAGLAMPHSPLLHRGRLLVLNSGLGTLERVDERSGNREVVASVPGFARGLACHGNLAFVGLSRIRETAVFGELPITEHRDDLLCGVGVIDLSSGRTVATLVFESGIEEIFDVQVIPGARFPAISGPHTDRDATGAVWVVPPERPLPGVNG